jgi:hypothetical protein
MDLAHRPIGQCRVVLGEFWQDQASSHTSRVAQVQTVSVGPSGSDKRRDMYYVGGIVFAAVAVLLVVVFIQKFRQRD